MTTVKRECMVMLLPTEKASTLSKDKYGPLYFGNYPEDNNMLNQFIYILSNDEIKEGDWVYNKKSKEVYKITIKEEVVSYEKKIIATTDTSLIGGVRWGKEFSFPQPSPQFIQKYVELYNKGKIIERCLVEYEIVPDFESKDRDNDGQIFNGLKKEELKVDENNYITITKVKDSLSKKDVEKLLWKLANGIVDGSIKPNDEDTNKWIKENL
jgi:hypothetical protein